MTVTELQAELRQMEEQIAELRAQVADVRRRIGEGWDEPTDSTEIASQIAMAEEQEAFISVLEERREELLRRLGER